MNLRWRRGAAGVLLAVVTATAGCQWRGLNSLPMPGTAGRGPGSFEITAQIPDVANIQRNSRVRVGDVNVGTVTAIQRQGWHALVTMRLDGDVDLPSNATATVGQTSLLGSLHIELAAPRGVPPRGKLTNGSLIPLAVSSTYPTTEETLSAVSMLLNGGGVGQVQDITKELTTAFANGRDRDLRNLFEQLNQFVTRLNNEVDDIVHASESLNNLAGQFAAQKPVVDQAFRTIPQALDVLNDERNTLVEAFDRLGKFSAITASSINQTKQALVQQLSDLGPVLESLANAGPALTRSLDQLLTFPFPMSTLSKWIRGDYANTTTILDLTASRLDEAFLTGTRFEGVLTQWEMQWGRTVGQLPSPYTAGNPLMIPYHFDQGN